MLQSRGICSRVSLSKYAYTYYTCTIVEPEGAPLAPGLPRQLGRIPVLTQAMRRFGDAWPEADGVQLLGAQESRDWLSQWVTRRGHRAWYRLDPGPAPGQLANSYDMSYGQYHG